MRGHPPTDNTTRSRLGGHQKLLDTLREQTATETEHPDTSTSTTPVIDTPAAKADTEGHIANNTREGPPAEFSMLRWT